MNGVLLGPDALEGTPQDCSVPPEVRDMLWARQYTWLQAIPVSLSPLLGEERPFPGKLSHS